MAVPPTIGIAITIGITFVVAVAARTNYFPYKILNYVYMAYMEAMYKFGRLCGHTIDKTFYLQVKNTNRRKRNTKYGFFGNYR